MGSVGRQGRRIPIDRIRIGHWSLDKKLIAMYAAMILLPMLVVTFLGFQTYNSNMKKKASAFSLELLTQLGKNVDNYYHELERISTTFSMDAGVEEALMTEKDSPSARYTEKKIIDQALMNIVLIPFQDVLGTYLIKPNGDIFSRYGSGQQVDYSGFAEETWYQEALQGGGKGVLLPTARTKSIEGREELAFSFLRSVIDVDKNQSAGVFRMDINLNGLKEIFENVRGGTDQELLIVDSQGRIIYDRDEGEITRSFPVALDEQSDSIVEQLDGRKVMVNYVTAPYSGWKIANVIPLKELTQSIEIIRNLLWTLSGVAVVLSIALSLFLTRRLLYPLKKMQLLMNKVENGDYSVQFKAQSNDEIGKLAGSFNHMVVKINELIRNVFMIRILKREADFKVLQSKINPHFLYNTLESISMKAEVDNNYEVADMISRLGRLFRMTINHDRETILLSKEMEYIEHYVKLQQIRFKGLIFVVEMAPEIMKSYILPWTIQPIVENAIVHGLAPLNHEGRIVIEGMSAGADILIRITDNGIGVDEKTVRDIQAHLLTDADQTEDEIHIGLKNISDRIRYYFGDRYGLTLSGKKGKGTTVEIRMLNMKEEGERRADDHGHR
jgi:two-component system sensor histidine kinase YesM